LIAGKDILWYTREAGKETNGATNFARLNAQALGQANVDEIRRAELRRAKEQEEDVMDQAL
jgi:hypothetical protein